MNEDKSARYHRLRRRSSIASTIVGVAFLIAFVGFGASAALRDFAVSLAGSSVVGLPRHGGMGPGGRGGMDRNGGPDHDGPPPAPQNS